MLVVSRASADGGGWRRRFALAAVACGAVISVAVSAHDLPLQGVMTAFVSIEPREAHVAIRVPLEILEVVGTEQFPVKGNVIDLAAAKHTIEQTLTILADGIILTADGVRLPAPTGHARLSLPSDRSFDDYVNAVAHIATPHDGLEIYAKQGFLDAHFKYDIESPDAVFAIQTTLGPELREFLRLSIRYGSVDGTSRAFLITGESGRVALNPTWLQAAGAFIALGVEHILSGIDHLLFLLLLILPYRQIRSLVPVITAFTVGHSVTLIGTAYGLAPDGMWFPPLVEVLIAASIVYLAVENILAGGAALGRRWIIAGLFGLVHGFGFSYSLAGSLQFAGAHLLASLFAFNLGVEIGQLAILVVLGVALSVLSRATSAQRTVIVLLSVIVAHTGWHWMIDRGTLLWQMEWPRLDALTLLLLARWLVAVTAAIYVAKLVARRAAHRWPARLGTARRLEHVTDSGAQK